MAQRLIIGPLKRALPKAIAAFGEGDALADIGHIGQKGFIIFGKICVPTGTARILSAPSPPDDCAISVNAGAGLKVLAIAIINQCVQPIDTFGNDIAAAPAIAVRAAKFDIFLRH